MEQNLTGQECIDQAMVDTLRGDWSTKLTQMEFALLIGFLHQNQEAFTKWMEDNAQTVQESNLIRDKLQYMQYNGFDLR